MSIRRKLIQVVGSGPDKEKKKKSMIKLAETSPGSQISVEEEREGASAGVLGSGDSFVPKDSSASPSLGRSKSKSKSEYTRVAFC